MKENWEKSYQLIVKTLNDYELGDAYLILQGLDLVGYEHIDFWFQLVEFVKQYKGIETLVAYIDVMQLIGREKLMYVLNDIENKSLNFQDSYNIFINLLIETKKYSEDLFTK